MPGAQGAAASGPEPTPSTTSPEGQPKIHRARKTMSKPGNGQVRIRGRVEGVGEPGNQPSISCGLFYNTYSGLFQSIHSFTVYQRAIFVSHSGLGLNV